MPDEDNAIPFPPSTLTRPSYPDGCFTTGSIYGLETCEEPIHIFDERPGRCRCGSEFWEAE
jgi:hypothetical protein